eukprot:TRINITY_DN31980_c0_g1_i1.p4 TRINITY_DN31980_c0_g1~~TRINITY_DN31980_c0_g1_i1.p4  ORF type:complete len:106 (-),score=1.07 TRINITY_DN31980_c0_g1_i1:250-567(-)
MPTIGARRLHVYLAVTAHMPIASLVTLRNLFAVTIGTRRSLFAVALGTRWVQVTATPAGILRGPVTFTYSTTGALPAGHSPATPLAMFEISAHGACNCLEVTHMF